MNLRLAFCVLTLMSVLALSTIIPLTPTAPTLDKGLMISLEYLPGMLSGARFGPSFSELGLAKFNLVGTMVYGNNEPRTWDLITDWILAAHAAGFRTFVNLYGDETNVSTVAEFTRLAAYTGTDIVALDEVISIFNMTQPQLEAVIEAGLAANPRLRFIINEWSPDRVRNAYDWTAKYAPVSVATDNYYNKTVIDLGIQLAVRYGKRPISWLIFIKGSQDFDCSKNLDDWITYVETRQIGAMFWAIDTAGTWTSQWSKVVAFDSLLYA